MIRLTALTWFFVVSCSTLAAADVSFPYQAKVIAEDVEIRCGPGTGFYVTGKIGRDQTVTVHRHDHGGWFMIKPPPGSFSWIESELVQRSGDRGVISLPPDQAGRAIVYIGSQLSDEHSFYGRELANGDEVTILGEKRLTGPLGPTQMYKILPPAQEFRWVKGEFLMPQNQQVQKQLAADPYQIPPQHRERLAAQSPPDRPVPLPANPASGTPAQAPPPETPVDREYARLDEIDRDYADIVKRPPGDWQLDGVAEAYRQLASSSSPRLVALVQQRLELVGKRQEIARHYQNFQRVSGEFASREAQPSFGPVAQRAPQAVPSAQPVTPVPGSFPEGAVVTPLPAGSVSENGSPDPMAVAPAAGSQPIPEANPPAESPLTGAGMLQQVRGPDGQMLYAAVSLDGKILSFLQPAEGVRFEEWLDKPVGFIGERSFDPQLGVDKTIVRELISVQLVR